MSYMTTATIEGQHAYRAWDGQWYIVGRDGEPTGQSAETRQQAVELLRAV